jgi:hypothetical protein
MAMLENKLERIADSLEGIEKLVEQEIKNFGGKFYVQRREVFWSKRSS